MARLKLTKRLINETPLPPEGPKRLWDTEVPGLHLRSSAGGTRSWYLNYRVETGRQRDLKLGGWPTMTVDLAREAARKAAGRIASGEDPAEEKQERRRAPRMNDLIERFLRDHVDVKVKPSTAALYRETIRNHIAPKLGGLRLTEVTSARLAAFHNEMRNTPRAANLAIAIVRKMFNEAVGWGLHHGPSNPAGRITKFPERRRHRYLSTEEFRRLWQVLDGHQEKAGGSDAPLAFKLLLLTGRRLGEVQGMRWEHIDFSSGRLWLPDSKVGSRTFHLPKEALALLETVRTERFGNARAEGHVVRGRKPGAPFDGFQKAWQRYRKEAGIDDVRIHDLRHSYASFAAEAGFGILEIREMLGHKTIQTTERYAHLTDRVVRDGVQRIGNRMGEMIASTTEQ